MTKSIDIFICSETWFSESYDEKATSINGYICYRDDRKNRVGGGVAIWVRNCFVSVLLPCAHSSDFECVIVKLTGLKLIVMAMYLPPNVANSQSSSTSINSFVISTLDEYLDINPDFDVVIAGDLNRFDVKDICCSFDLRNINNFPTYANAELDYILFSESLSNNYIVSLRAPFDRSKVPHKSLLATPLFESCDNSQHIVKRVYDLRLSFIESFVSKIDSVDWSFLDNPNLSLNDKCSLFQSLLEAAAKECIPISYVKFTACDKPWITPLVKDLINKRWNAYRRCDYSAYNHLKAKVQVEIQKAKFLWTKKMQDKDIWKMVKSHLGRNSSTPIMSLLSQYDSIKEAADAINSHLFSVFVKSDQNSIKYLPESDNDWIIEASPLTIQKMLQQLSDHKSSPDIPNVLYKSVASQIAVPLSKLFKLSFSLGLIPATWKRAVISPIPKTRTPSVQDIRPISLLPPLAKVMEKVVLSSIKSDILEHYDTNQFGFRPNSSTQCALTSLHNQATIYLDDPFTFGVLIVSYDYSKAFDRLRFDLIIQRLIDCNFPSKVVAWMSDYLKSRTQVVRIGEVQSHVVEITSGVPQGSILGPFLYSFATATYKPISKNCHVLKYADDTSLVFPLYKSSSNNHVVEEHRHLLAWSAQNGLQMNVDKCKALTIRKSNIRCSIILPALPGVEFVEEISILGVIFNSKFTWTSHVDQIIKKCSRLLFAFRLIRSTVTSSNLKLLYYSLVRSAIEYCSPVYVGLSARESRRLDYLQKRFHKLICSTDCKHSCLPSLSDRRLLLALKFLHKIMIDDHILHNQLPTCSRFGRFLLPPRRTERRSKSFFLFACEQYNFLLQRKALK